MKELLSLRLCNDQFYNIVMYEWEDELIQKGLHLQCRSILSKKIGILLHRIIPGRGRILQYKLNTAYYKRNKLAFLMFASQYTEYYPSHIIPIFIDTRVKSFNILIKAIKNVDTAVITNRSAWDKAIKIYPAKKLYHLPLWCAEKWALSEIPEKTIDVLQIGRKNQLLHQWMLKYTESRPDVEYIYQDDSSINYISTKRGNMGPLPSREDYMNAIRKAKICLVSSPLVDDSPEFDFITPRVYEAAISYCYMVGRFTENSEFNEVKLNKVVDNVKNYEEFCSHINKYIESDTFFKLAEFKEFNSINSFESRYQELSEFLDL